MNFSKKAKLILLIIFLLTMMLMTSLQSCSTFSTSTTILVDSASVQGLQFEKVNKLESHER